MKLFSNFPVKLLSLILAASLWVGVSLNQSRAGIFPGNISIEYVNLAKNLAAISDDSSVSVKIIAEPNVWGKLSAKNFIARADLANLTEGTHRVDVQVESANPDVQIVEKTPTKILVRIESISTKNFPVTVKAVGDPKDGLAITSTQTKPNLVSVSGASSLVDRIVDVTTDLLLSKDSSKTSFKSVVKAIDSAGQEIKDVNISPREVEVNIKYGRAATVKSVGVKVNTTGVLGPGLILDNITVDPTIISINGSLDNVNKIKFIATQPISLDKITTSTTIDGVLDLPDGITLVDTSGSIKITLNIKTTLDN